MTGERRGGCGFLLVLLAGIVVLSFGAAGIVTAGVPQVAEGFNLLAAWVFFWLLFSVLGSLLVLVPTIAVLRRQRGDREAAAKSAPPDREPDAVRFCPACGAQYAREEEICGDCGAGTEAF